MGGPVRCRTPPGATLAGCFRAGQGETDCRDYLRHAPHGRATGSKRRQSDFAFLRTILDVHVFEFAGFEDLAAFLTFDELGILIPAHDLHAGMFAGLLGVTVLRRGGRLWSHKSGRFPRETLRRAHFGGISRYFRPALPVVKTLYVNPPEFVNRRFGMGSAVRCSSSPLNSD
jgi:hypothetical protein